MKSFEEWTRELIGNQSQKEEAEDIYIECHGCGEEIDQIEGEDYYEDEIYYCGKMNGVYHE